MAALVMTMIVCLLLGLGVVLAVAVSARREGKDLLTLRGEHVVARVRERTDLVGSVGRGRAARGREPGPETREPDDALEPVGSGR